MDNPPLEIVGKRVKPAAATAEPALRVVRLKGKGNRHSFRADAAIDKVLFENKPVSVAMVEAGYSAESASNLSVKETRQWEERVGAHVERLQQHRDKVLAQMDRSYETAPYAALSMALDSITKQIQLLTGKATGRIGFDIPEEERSRIRDIIIQNAEPGTQEAA